MSTLMYILQGTSLISRSTIFLSCSTKLAHTYYAICSNIYNIYFVHLIKKYSFSNKYSTIINKQFQFMQYTSLVNT